MGFGKHGSRGSDVAKRSGRKGHPKKGYVGQAAIPPRRWVRRRLITSEAALQGDQLERSMKSFQKRLNSAFFPLCICTALAYLCT
jgi:hypothetical protein